MKANNMKKNVYVFFIKIIKSEEYKYLRIVYAVSFLFSIIMFLFGLKEVGDTASYYAAKDIILNGNFDHLRTPLYPIFLAITQHRFITIFVQWLIFFVSIAFLYKTLENIKISSRLIFFIMIIYVCHPVFIYYQNQRIPEALCISFSSIFAYYLVAFIKTEKISYLWIFHTIILCLILLKPGFLFLLIIPVMLLLYIFFAKKKFVLSSIMPFLLVLLLIGAYGFAIKKTYGVYSLSSVSDVNLYWMLRKQDKINLNSIENGEVKSFVSEKINIKYENIWNYWVEANEIFNQYGWNELHNIVRGSLKENYKSILFDKKNLLAIKNNLYDPVGRSLDFFVFRNACKEYDIANFFPYFNFYVLLFILLIYFGLITKQVYSLRAIPVISTLFLLYIVANFVSLILTAPNNYGRLIVPSISILLIVCGQCVEWFVLFIQKKEKQFKLL